MSALAVAWVPRFVYNSVTLTLTYPFRPPRMASWTVPGTAGREESASGVPSVWPGTRLRSIAVRLRFDESEWSNVRSFLEWAVGGASFTFYPDVATLGTSYTVYLLSPTVTDRIAPDLGADGVMELDIELRQTSGSAIDLAYYAAGT